MTSPPLVLSLRDHDSPPRSKPRRRNGRRRRVTRPGREPSLLASLRPSESGARVHPPIKRDKNRPMVKSKSKRRSSHWQIKVVIRWALDSGIPGEDILDMVQTEVNGNQTFHEPRLSGFESYDGDTIFTELPDGLIDIPTAAKKYQIKGATLRAWVRKGHLKLQGRLKGPTWGGGSLVVLEAALKEYISEPKDKGGRPRKWPMRVSIGV